MLLPHKKMHRRNWRHARAVCGEGLCVRCVWGMRVRCVCVSSACQVCACEVGASALMRPMCMCVRYVYVCQVCVCVSRYTRELCCHILRP